MDKEKAIKALETQMQKSEQSLTREFAAVRTGRANPAMLDSIFVDYHGSQTKLNQLGNISSPDPLMLVFSAWEKNILPLAEKAILKSDLGITPISDGQVLRLPTPQLTEERRQQLSKQVKKIAEDRKNSLRNLRRDGNNQFKALEKNKEISEDEQRQFTDKIQKITDQHIKNIDALTAKKQKELFED